MHGLNKRDRLHIKATSYMYLSFTYGTGREGDRYVEGASQAHKILVEI